MLSAPSKENELRINGISLVFYSFYVSEKSLKIIGSKNLKEVKCKQDYRMVLGNWREEFHQSDLFEFESYLSVPEFDLPYAGKVSGAIRLFFQQINERILFALTVVNFNLSQDSFCPVHLHSSAPLRVDDVIDIVDKLGLKGNSLFDKIEEQRRFAIELCFGDCKPLVDAYQNRSLLGIEIWDIANVVSSKPIPIQDLVQRFSWEIAALLSCTDDRIRINHAWRKLTKDEVQKITGKVRSSTGAYGVLTSGSICLEIFQYEMLTKYMTPELLERTTSRLSVYGYDSTSIFLWGSLAVLDFVTSYYNNYLSGMLSEVHKLTTLHAANSEKLQDTLSKIIQLKLEIYRALDRVYWLFEAMPEARRLQFFREGVASLRLGDEVNQVERKLNALSSIFEDISQTVTSADENTTIREIRDLGVASDNTAKIVLFLSALTAITASIELASFLSNILNGFITPMWEGLLALFSFSCIILLCWYMIHSYSKRVRFAKSTKSE